MKRTRNYIVLLVLCVIFLAPGVSAYLFFAHPQWLNHATTNRGILLKPPVRLPVQGLAAAKWTLVLWRPQACDKICIQQLNKLARVRLALGRRLYALQLVLLLNDEVSAPLKDLTKTLKERDISISMLTHHELKIRNVLGDSPRIFIANPDHYLILSYATAIKPEDIYHDIKQLLTQ
jgi:hypothetical protein